MRCPQSAGWLLVGLIVLTSAVILALVGITFYLTEHLRATSLRQNQTRAIYLAQAGVMYALYTFRTGAGMALRAYNVDNPGGPVPGATDDAFILSSNDPSDFLLMNMRAQTSVPFPTSNLCPSTGPGRVPRDILQDWPVRNVRTVTSLIVQRFKVDWDPITLAANVIRLDLNGTSHTWQAAGCVPPSCTAVTCVGNARDTWIDLSSLPAAGRTLSAGARWPQNRVWFSSNAIDSLNWVDVFFEVTDGTVTSVRRARWDRVTVANRTADVTIRSTGEVREGSFPFLLWRRLQANHRICRAVSGTACDSDAEERTQEGAVVAYQELTTLSP